MISDANNILRLSGALNTLPEPSFSADSIDLLAAKDIGAGSTLKAVFDITANITGTAAFGADLQVTLNTLEAGDAAPLIIGSTGLRPFAELLATTKPIEVRLNHVYDSIGRRYLKARYVTSDGSVFTAGNVVLRIVREAESGAQKSYPSGFVVAT